MYIVIQHASHCAHTNQREFPDLFVGIHGVPSHTDPLLPVSFPLFQYHSQRIISH